jgi:prophage regulatory protein
LQSATQPALLRRNQVQTRTGLARSTLYALVARRQFPAPVTLTGKAVAWVAEDVDRWIADRIAAGKTA